MPPDTADPLTTLFDVSLDMLFIRDLAGASVRLNKAWERTLGYTVEELLEVPLLTLVHPDDVDATRAAILRVEGQSEAIGFVNRYRRKDGAYRHVEWRAVRSGNLVFGFARDVTERLAMEVELQLAKRAAEEACLAKTAFLANMSHELRTPLTSIIGFSELLQKHSANPEAQQRYVGRIHEASLSLLATINDILDFSKLEAGQLEVERRALDPVELARSVLDLFEPQAREKGIVRLLGEANLPKQVLGDETRIRQILMNLVSNAIKFTAQGGVTVRPSYDHDRLRLRYEIIDTGPGIPAARQSRLFKRFSQADASTTRAFGGTGLGLAICRGLAETMGGTVGLRSIEGEGSCFWLDIPCDPTNAEGAAPTEADGPDDITATLDGLRVLVVDDNPVNRELVCTITEPLGVRVTEAEDGDAAVNLTGAAQFDLILMDVRMPGLDGPAAARLIRARPGPNRSTPIIGFTADADEPGPAAWSGLFDGRLKKPIVVGDLLTALIAHSGVGDPACARRSAAG